MKTGLYRIDVLSGVNLPEVKEAGMFVNNEGVAFVKLQPVKVKGTPKKEKPIIGLDGTVYTQDQDKQGWTGHTPAEVKPLDAVTAVKAMCLAWHGCLNCPLLEWCQNLPPDGKPMTWYIPVKEV